MHTFLSMPATETPPPIARAQEELPKEFKGLCHQLEGALKLPGHSGKDHPGAIVGYCLQVLGGDAFRDAHPTMRNAVQLLNIFSKGRRRHNLLDLSPTGLHAFLYPVFEISWRQETAAPALQSKWSQQRPGIGQQVTTALVLQQHIGGELFIAKSATPICAWNLLKGEGGRSQQADLTRREPGEFLPKGSVEICAPERLKQACPWAEDAATRLDERFKTALLAYAFAAYTLVHRSPHL